MVCVVDVIHQDVVQGPLPSPVSSGIEGRDKWTKFPYPWGLFRRITVRRSE